MEKKGRIAALFIATAMLMPQIPAYAEGNSVVTDNGITASVQNAEAGETVTLELPEGYVEGSLVISYKDSEDKTDIPENIEKQSDGSYSFTMPDYNVYASCLVNTDADKLIVVGTTSSYYVRKDNTLEVSFDVPEGEYSSAEANIPVRAHAYNAKNMKAVMNGDEYQVNGGVVSGTGTSIEPGAVNVMTVTNENENGVDYFYNAKSYYPVTASDLATLTLTLSDESGQNVWSGYRDGSFTGEVPDYSIAWKITNNTNDRKGASHSIDEQNNIITITSSDGAEPGDVLYGVSAAIKNIQPNTRYTLTFKEKTNMTAYENNGVYINAITVATTANSIDPDATKDTETLNSGKLSDLHKELTDDQEWCSRSIEYVSGSGLPSGYDTLEAKFTFMLRGCTGSVRGRSSSLKSRKMGEGVGSDS